MKIIVLALVWAVTAAACGGTKKDGAAVAKEICDCYTKANGMDPASPGRAKAQQDCLEKQGTAWNKIKDDAKESAAFNATFSDCSKEMIKRSFGK